MPGSAVAPLGADRVGTVGQVAAARRRPVRLIALAHGGLGQRSGHLRREPVVGQQLRPPGQRGDHPREPVRRAEELPALSVQLLRPEAVGAPLAHEVLGQPHHAARQRSSPVSSSIASAISSRPGLPHISSSVSSSGGAATSSARRSAVAVDGASRCST